MSSKGDGGVHELFREIEALKRDVYGLHEEWDALWDEVNEILDDLKKGKYTQAARTVSETVAVNPDSVTVGAPSNGQVKVYGNGADAEAFKKKIQAMANVLTEARQIVNGSG